MMPEELAEISGLEFTPAQLSQLVGHLDAVLEASRTMNLTAIRDRDNALRLHVLDSLFACKGATEFPRGPILDLGSGAGFPGIPLAIVTGRETVLLEATRKKCAFLESCVSELGLTKVYVSCSRAEELAQESEFAGRFAVVVSRAVADLPVLIELCAPFLRSDGIIVAMKGRISDEELERGDRAGEIVGVDRNMTQRYVLPGNEESRALIWYQKVRGSRIVLPRRSGVAKKRPLA